MQAYVGKISNGLMLEEGGVIKIYEKIKRELVSRILSLSFTISFCPLTRSKILSLSFIESKTKRDDSAEYNTVHYLTSKRVIVDVEEHTISRYVRACAQKSIMW